MQKKTTINKSVLKKIVKECIVEIFAEGLGGDLNEQIAESRSNKVLRVQPQQRTQPKISASSQRAREEFLNELAASTAGNNPIMAEMFKETLESGRAEKFANDSDVVVSPKDAMSQAIEDMSPEEMFGDVANTWAQAAFMGMDLPEEK